MEMTFTGVLSYIQNFQTGNEGEEIICLKTLHKKSQAAIESLLQPAPATGSLSKLLWALQVQVD